LRSSVQVTKTGQSAPAPPAPRRSMNPFVKHRKQSAMVADQFVMRGFLRITRCCKGDSARVVTATLAAFGFRPRRGEQEQQPRCRWSQRRRTDARSFGRTGRCSAAHRITKSLVRATAMIGIERRRPDLAGGVRQHERHQTPRSSQKTVRAKKADPKHDPHEQ